MKILVLADIESDYLWDYKNKDYLCDVDLILSCGDLNAQYLSFLVTICKAPVLYVHGNHDDKYALREPEGCDCIEDDLVTVKGLRILGLGGSYRYKDGIHQYTEKEMRKRAAKLRGKIRRAKGFDILLTHAPALDLGDASDLPHKGFAVFRELMELYNPSYMIHGHVHANYIRQFKRIRQHHETQIINAYDHYLLEI